MARSVAKASALEVAVDGLVRPLRFAAQDDFAAVDRVRGLEASIVAGCDRLRERAMPADLRAVVDAIAAAFQEPLERAEREQAVRRSLTALASVVGEPGWAARMLARPLTALAGVGPKRAQTLARKGLAVVSDLLFHLPVQYDDRRSLVHCSDLEVGLHATFIAEVKSVGSAPSRRGGRPGKVLTAVVSDGSGSAELVWFRGGEALSGTLKPGAQLVVTGEVKRYRFSKQLVHPEVERVDDASSRPEEAGLDGLRRVVPRYSTPDGMSGRALRRLIEQATAEYADLLPGRLDPQLVQARGLPEPASALRSVHTPPLDAVLEDYRGSLSPAHERLILEELYLLELGLALRRSTHAALPGIGLDTQSGEAALAGLPFQLTSAQRRSWDEIRGDLERPHPMNRLLQGDVGSGKTAIAYLAAAAVAANGYQTALMAPTELLAEQHLRSLRQLAEGARAGDRPLRVELLTASVPRSAGLRAAIEKAEVDLVVGTHALVQKELRFGRLALAVIDEQHRFGVMQRAALAEKLEGEARPHTLVMTATPIPRTLALTLYGDLDLSVIDELPPGRSPVETLLLRTGEGRQISQMIEECAERGEQVYVVYPLVAESAKSDLRAAAESAARIAHAFPKLSVDLVHGRLDSEARGQVMERFRRGDTRILVSTSVIEVGVDVPTATLMVIEHAERFGLAQLHQLRGRVGRGALPGRCVLVARGGGEESEARLRAILETTDGFRIADADLQLRGPGEFLGTRQSGTLPDFRVAQLSRDARLVSVAREAALAAVRRDPGLARAPELREAVERHWGAKLSLASIA
jgi:ATP-dependent DNA helicase RecG